MDKYVTSLETSKRLKTAGFPQTTEFVWGNIGELWDRETYEALKSREAFAAPTAEEIAEQLPESHFTHGSSIKHLRIRKVKTGWRVGYYAHRSTDYIQAIAKTQAEALAALYLQIQGGINNG